MKMAKASAADLDMAMELCGALDALTQRWGALVPDKIAKKQGDDDDATELFDIDDHEQCKRVLGYLLAVVNRGSLMRVVGGCAVMLDPSNQCVDPNADTLEHHPNTITGQKAATARALHEWDEDMGPVLWWMFPVCEDPYCGTPHDDDWPEYHTHWTPLVVPEAPRAYGLTSSANQARE